MLWLACLCNYADRLAVPAIFPALRSEFHFTPVQLGLIGSAFMWVYALGAPLAGYLGDRLTRKNLIIGGCLGWSLVTGATAWCGRLWQFLAVRALVGAGETFYFPASMSLLSDYHGRRTRSTALSLHQSSVYAGTIAGSVAAGWMAERWGWRRGFFVFGAVGLAVALLLRRFLREPRRGAAEPETAPAPAPSLAFGEALRLTFRRPAAWLLMAAFFGANSVAAIFLTWMPTFLVDKFGYGLARANLAATVFISLASAAGGPPR
ncbi:MAG TPA: MFS transporter, partial [Opitutaceae bacterium]|nr:MFS transporter [Opitutaceae bacterium]